MRPADLPLFLAELLAWHLDGNPRRKYTCRNTEEPWCPGGEYVFLGQRNAHHRRSNYATRIVRPAADGWYTRREGRYGRPNAPVLVDFSAPWPGVPLSPWPPAIPGEPMLRQLAGGYPGLRVRTAAGGVLAVAGPSSCGRMARSSGTKSVRNAAPARRGRPVNPPRSRAGYPLRPGLTPHGLRHGHQTWLDDLGVRYVLQSERMGHEVPGMRGVYSHITSRMRDELLAGLQRLWEDSLRERAALAERSSVVILDELMASLT